MASLIDRVLYKIDKECNILDIIILKCYFHNRSQEEIYKVACVSDNINAIRWLPNLSVEDKVKCIRKIGKKHKCSYDDHIELLLMSKLYRNDSDLLLECLKYFELDTNRYKVLRIIKDEYKRLLGMNSLEIGNFLGYYDEIIKKIKNKQNLIRVYQDGNLKIEVKKAIILVMEDEFKELHLSDFEYADRLDIIQSFKSDEFKKKYALLKEYVDFQAEIISGINDENFVIKMFIENQNVNFRFKLVTLITNKKLKNKLVDLMATSVIKDVLKSNQFKKNDKKKLNSVIIPDELIDPRITFGIELECCGGESYEFLVMEKILKNWKITADGSVDGGIEIISPVLKYDYKSLQELQYICNLLRRGEFYTDERCGGHIHFGFNYFSNVQEFDVFLKFYCAIEELLFILSNKSGTIVRDGALNYAQKFSQLYNASSLVVYAEKIRQIGRYTKIVRDIPGTRYYALNIKNIGIKEKNTIEFRMPNGEIDFDELILNILLFAKVMEKAKELSNLLHRKKKVLEQKQLLEKYHVVLNESINSSDRVKFLISLLFTNEDVKNKFLERYNQNVKAYKLKKIKQNRFIENEFN